MPGLTLRQQSEQKAATSSEHQGGTLEACYFLQMRADQLPKSHLRIVHMI